MTPTARRNRPIRPSLRNVPSHWPADTTLFARQNTAAKTKNTFIILFNLWYSEDFIVLLVILSTSDWMGWKARRKKTVSDDDGQRPVTYKKQVLSQRSKFATWNIGCYQTGGWRTRPTSWFKEALRTGIEVYDMRCLESANFVLFLSGRERRIKTMTRTQPGLRSFKWSQQKTAHGYSHLYIIQFPASVHKSNNELLLLLISRKNRWWFDPKIHFTN